MFLPIAAAAAFIISDGYDPARGIAWLCSEPEAAAEIGVKVDEGASSDLISAFANARKCVSWESGTLNVREVMYIGSQEIGLIRLSYGGGPEISYWVARNTVRWTRPGGNVRAE
jgi:hypothetical protein